MIRRCHCEPSEVRNDEMTSNRSEGTKLPVKSPIMQSGAEPHQNVQASCLSVKMSAVFTEGAAASVAPCWALKECNCVHNL